MGKQQTPIRTADETGPKISSVDARWLHPEHPLSQSRGESEAGNSQDAARALSFDSTGSGLPATPSHLFAACESPEAARRSLTHSSVLLHGRAHLLETPGGEGGGGGGGGEGQEAGRSSSRREDSMSNQTAYSSAHSSDTSTAYSKLVMQGTVRRDSGRACTAQGLGCERR